MIEFINSISYSHSLKDSKTNFQHNPQYRSLNPTKSNTGKISKYIIERVRKFTKETLGINQWKPWNSLHLYKRRTNLRSFNSIFVSFNPSVTENLLMSAVNLSKDYCTIRDNEFKIIMQAQKPILYHNGGLWTIRNNTQFNIAMGLFNSEEACELVGILLLW